MTNNQTTDKNTALAFIVSIAKTLDGKGGGNTGILKTLEKYVQKRHILAEVFPEIYDFMPGIIAPRIEFNSQFGTEYINAV